MATTEEETLAAEEQASNEAAEAEEAKAQEEEDEQAEEDEAKDPGSSMVSTWAYNRENEEIEVAFQNGHEESYPCSPELWAEASDTSSAGKFMHANFL